MNEALAVEIHDSLSPRFVRHSCNNSRRLVHGNIYMMAEAKLLTFDSELVGLRIYTPAEVDYDFAVYLNFAGTY